jgi:cytochrome c1
VSISLVYAATRDEQMAPILHHALRLGLWIIGFMAVVFAVLFYLQSGL